MNVVNLELRRDMPLLLPMVVLIGLGWVMVFSTAAMLDGGETYGSVFHHLKRQMIATGLGAIALLTVARIPHVVLIRYVPTVLAVTGLLMLMVFIPGLGKSVSRATRWLNVGVFSFQPVEVFKLAVVLSYAALLSQERPREDWSLESWCRIAGLAGLSVALPILQRDFGSAVLMLSLGVSLMWLAGARIQILMGFVATGATAVAALLLSAPYRINRIKTYLAAWGSPDGAGYQTKQSLIALGAGGFLGVGLGESGQKLFYLPLAHADFIFSIIGEELGFIGALTVVALYLLLLHQGLGVAQLAHSRFARLLASGLTLLIFFQAMWHIGVAVVLLPTKGLTLPFVSYGGSSLVSSMLAVGLILCCATETRIPKTWPGMSAFARSGAWTGS